MKTTILVLVLLASAFALTGCAQQTIAELKTEEMIGEDVRVSGTVQTSLKLGELSGYIIEDESGESIGVSSETLPAEGTEVTVRGVLVRDTIFGYYIRADE
jgi:hypothetical protein